MDLKAVINGSGEVWTEERHTSFLNSIEESFVRRMLGLDDHGDFHRFMAPCSAFRSDRLPKLDRYVPDSATESTRDLRSLKCNRGTETRNLATTSHDSTRKRVLLPPYDASQDQVVPQFGSTNADSKATKKHKKGGNQEFRCL